MNEKFKYPRYISMIPSGPDTKPSFTEGFFAAATKQNPKPQTVALAWSDLEFSKNACEGARDNIKKAGLKIVYDKSYPGNTTDFTPIVRAVQAANPDILTICSYPLDSVGMVQTLNEAQLQAEDGRRRDGRFAGHRVQDQARSAAQRHHQL